MLQLALKGALNQIEAARNSEKYLCILIFNSHRCGRTVLQPFLAYQSLFSDSSVIFPGALKIAVLPAERESYGEWRIVYSQTWSWIFSWQISLSSSNAFTIAALSSLHGRTCLFLIWRTVTRKKRGHGKRDLQIMVCVCFHRRLTDVVLFHIQFRLTLQNYSRSQSLIVIC